VSGEALLLQHDPDAPAGLIASWLAERGIAGELVSVPAVDRLPDPTPYQLVVSLGSEACVNDELAWAREEEGLLRRAHQAGVPVLGVCFGGQLLARALGGAVERASACEIGWRTVRSNRPGLVGPGPWFQWHFDTVRPPAAAEVIARSHAGVEAFVWERSMGLQFHPEVTPEIISGWARSYRDELEAHTVSVAATAATAAADPQAARARTFELLDAFAAHTGMLARSQAAGPALPPR
jgi:GMP synthase-like glutamine amidotransferase